MKHGWNEARWHFSKAGILMYCRYLPILLPHDRQSQRYVEEPACFKAGILIQSLHTVSPKQSFCNNNACDMFRRIGPTRPDVLFNLAWLLCTCKKYTIRHEDIEIQHTAFSNVQGKAKMDQDDMASHCMKNISTCSMVVVCCSNNASESLVVWPKTNNMLPTNGM